MESDQKRGADSTRLDTCSRKKNITFFLIKKKKKTFPCGKVRVVSSLFLFFETERGWIYCLIKGGRSITEKQERRKKNEWRADPLGKKKKKKEQRLVFFLSQQHDQLFPPLPLLSSPLLPLPIFIQEGVREGGGVVRREQAAPKFDLSDLFLLSSSSGPWRQGCQV